MGCRGWRGPGRRPHSSSASPAVLVMAIWEWRSPGGAPRRGMLAIDTTRGDRLFISLLGSAFIHLAWLGLFGTPLWGAFAVSLVFGLAVFRWV